MVGGWSLREGDAVPVHDTGKTFLEGREDGFHHQGENPRGELMDYASSTVLDFFRDGFHARGSIGLDLGEEGSRIHGKV